MVDVLESLVGVVTSGLIDTLARDTYEQSIHSSVRIDTGAFVEALQGIASDMRKRYDCFVREGMVVPSECENDHITVLLYHTDSCWTHGTESVPYEQALLDSFRLALRVDVLQKAVSYLTKGRVLPSDGSLKMNDFGKADLKLAVNIPRRICVSLIPSSRPDSFTVRWGAG